MELILSTKNKPAVDDEPLHSPVIGLHHGRESYRDAEPWTDHMVTSPAVQQEGDWPNIDILQQADLAAVYQVRTCTQPLDHFIFPGGITDVQSRCRPSGH